VSNWRWIRVSLSRRIRRDRQRKHRTITNEEKEGYTVTVSTNDMKLHKTQAIGRTKEKQNTVGNVMGCVDREKSDRVEMLKISTFDPISILGRIVYQTFFFWIPLSDIP
jgi:tRNA G10  N-methylase Trm11